MRLDRKQKEVIAYNILALRETKYPGWGGGKKCAKDFGVSHSHWSPWEAATRTPDEDSLKRLADFFGVTVDAITTSPEDWASKRAAWDATRRKRRGKRGANKGEEEPDPIAPPPAASAVTDEETEDYLESVKLLAKIQSLRDRGVLSPQAYQAKMRHIIGVIKFVMES